MSEDEKDDRIEEIPQHIQTAIDREDQREYKWRVAWAWFLGGLILGLFVFALTKSIGWCTVALWGTWIVGGIKEFISE